ncbi:MAG: hypothetical protein IKN55_02550 [Oscillospiraceae bacterium]|nr:hypothetical protein [Oscillospiraceae bacterium]
MKFTQMDLWMLGIFFPSEEEETMFLEVLNEDFEIRMGYRISARLECETQRELSDSEFEAYIESWVMLNQTEARDLINDCMEEVRQDVLKYRAEIPGILTELPEHLRSLPLDDMNLTVRSYHCLKGAGINTLGEVFDCEDLTAIPYIRKRNVEEILTSLSRMIR